MNLFNKLNNNLERYLTDNEFKIIIKDDYLNIINYKEIIDFSSAQIIIKADNKLIKIIGNNLVVSKMQDNEALITGDINKVEL
ncbi:MAG: YabP/YqfC family sporulation protein [Bacilli bacterium]|nr:YabP/YqfC family sporulation protein [Bacilli bacterium]